MPELPTFDGLYALGKAEAQARNAELTDFEEGSSLDAITGSGSLLADVLIEAVRREFAKHFIDTAEGADLDALAADRFNLTRNAASASVGTVRFTRDGAGAVLYPAGTRVQATVNGVSVTVETDTDATMAAAANTLDVSATCTETGRAGNLAAGTLTTLLDPPAGDPGATVTNLDRFAGGAAAETPAAFRDRIRRYFQTLRKGTVAALEAGALSVAGVAFATVDESNIDPDDGGYVGVYVGDPDGAGNSVLAAAVDAELDDWRAAGIQVQVLAAAREEIALAFTVTVLKGSDRSALGDAIRNAIRLGYLDELAANQTYYASKAESLAHAVDRTAIRAVAQTTPTARWTAPSAAHKALRVNEEDITLTWVEV